jgi:hypothetical integral membrane protein (TIGR02206 family)
MPRMPGNPMQRGTRMDFFTLKPSAPAFEYTMPGNVETGVILATVAMALLIVVFRRQLREDKKLDRKVRIIATAIAIAVEVGYHIQDFYYHYNPTDMAKADSNPWVNLIPLMLCAISLWLSVAICITKSNKIFEILYFTSFGALLSLLIPNDSITGPGLGPDRFRFYSYIGVHMYIVLVVVYFAVVYRHKIHLSSLLKTFAILIPASVVLRYVDIAFSDIGLNYQFLAFNPGIPSPLDWLPVTEGWGYTLGVMAMGVVVFIVMALPWMVVDLFSYWKKRRTRTRMQGSAES